jgi:anti-sigma regulatory factor (Ser/Thr protein kinase)
VTGSVTARAAPAAARSARTRVSSTADQLAAVMAVSAAVAEAGDLDETLTQIARTAASLVGAKACAVYLRESEIDEKLTVVASYGLSERYVHHLNELQPLVVGHGPSGLAIHRAEPIQIDDIQSDALCEPWRPVAVQERVRAMLSVPLRSKGSFVMGGLNAYREEPGPWTRAEVDLLSLLCDHAAIAIRTAHLLDHTRRQVEGLSLMVRSLRAQGHEHSNRLHAIYGLLALGEVKMARQMIASIEEGYHSIYGRATTRIENATLAGFLVAESVIALQSGIRLTVDARSRLSKLPPGLDDLDAVTVLGNLIHNAVEAVTEMSPSRRRIAILVLERSGKTVLRVRDWGQGVDAQAAARMFERDYTTKSGHSGIGLSLVESIVKRCRGDIDVESPRGGGASITVTFAS